MEIELSSFTQNDISQEYLSWLSDELLMRYSQQSKIKHSRATAISYLAELKLGGGELLKIIQNSTQMMIGTISLRKSSEKIIDIGMLIGADGFRNKGYGSIAWGLGMSYAWNHFSIEKITAGTNRNNEAMLRIMQKHEMSFEETRIEEGEIIFKYSSRRPR